MLWAHPKAQDVVVAVADTSAKAVEIARRACRIAEKMGVGRVIAVANRCSGPNDAARMEAAIGLPVFVVPEDRVVGRADHEGIGPLDVAAESPAMNAVGDWPSSWCPSCWCDVAYRPVTTGVVATAG